MVDRKVGNEDVMSQRSFGIYVARDFANTTTSRATPMHNR
jgi:hypothetical protein